MDSLSCGNNLVFFPKVEWENYKDALLPEILSNLEIREYGNIKGVCKLFSQVLEDTRCIRLAQENSLGKSNLFRVLSKKSSKTFSQLKPEIDHFSFIKRFQMSPPVKFSDSLYLNPGSYLFVGDGPNKITCLGPDNSIIYCDNHHFELKYLANVGDYLIFQDKCLHISTGKMIEFSKELIEKLEEHYSFKHMVMAIGMSKNQFIFFNNIPQDHGNLRLTLCEIKDEKCLFVKSFEIDVLKSLSASKEERIFDQLSSESIKSYQDQLFIVLKTVDKNKFYDKSTFLGYVCEFNIKTEGFKQVLKTNEEIYPFHFYLTNTGDGFIKQNGYLDQIISKGKILEFPKQTGYARFRGEFAIGGLDRTKPFFPLYNLQTGQTVCSKVKKEFIDHMLFIEDHTLFYLAQGDKSQGEIESKINSVFLPTQQIIETFNVEQELPNHSWPRKSMIKNGKMLDFYYNTKSDSTNYDLCRLRVKILNDKTQE